ncbi:HEAT repeat domain-containing protein [Plantactinospora sp. CA-294935]|uniref:HEAT repeat domain-containing protein n=1 Tax=Plantactinospora sp. CA-294935 TaxID=3240012 RepID=UPI003D8F10FA
MTVGRGEKWPDWRRDVFGDPYLVWHDGPDFARLLSVARDEPEVVARMLGVGVAAADSLAAESIAALAGAGLAPSGAEALLRAALPAASGTFQVRVAQALHVLTGDESWAEPVASVLAEGAHWGERIDAATALAGFAPTPRLVEALARAVRDRHYLVRYHAANTLLRYAGRRTDVSTHPALFALIRSGDDDTEPDAEVTAQRAEAARRLSAAALSRQSVDPDRS